MDNPREDQVFIALEIRDQVDHESAPATTGEFTAETIIINNGLDQTVTIQLQGSRDKTTWIDVGPVFNVPAATNDYDTVTDYFPFYQIVASCGADPSSGALDAWILKAKGAR